MLKKAKLFATITAVALLAPVVASCSSTPDTSQDVSVSTSTSVEAPSSSSESISTVAPVQLIQGANDFPDTVVVGDSVNLDDYINVRGGEGPKVYNVTINKKYKDFVSADGHMITFLAEGNVQINISAGSGTGIKTTIVSTNVVSKLLNEFKQFSDQVSMQYALLEYDENTDEFVTDTVHDVDYAALGKWDYDDAKDAYIPGGVLRCKNGDAHEFELNADWTKIDVKPGLYQNFEYLFLNMGYDLDTRDLETVTEINKTTREEDTYLVLYNDVESLEYSDYFVSKVEELFCRMTGFLLNDNYVLTSIKIRNIDLSPKEDGSDRHWIFFFMAAEAKTPLQELGSAGTYLMVGPNEDYHADTVRKYIDDGLFPEPIKFDSMTKKIDDVIGGQNFKAEVTGRFTDQQTGKPALNNEDIESMEIEGLSILNNFQETIYVTPTKTYSEENGKFVYGTEKVGNQTYYYDNVPVEGVEDTYTCYKQTDSKLHDGRDMEGVASLQGLLSTSDNYNGFRVSDVEEITDGTRYMFLGNTNLNWFIDLGCFSDAGYGLVSYASQVGQRASESDPSINVDVVFGYIDVTCDITSENVLNFTMTIPVIWVEGIDSTVYNYVITYRITNSGTTVCPAFPANVVNK